MVRCTTCSLLIRESRIAFAARVGGDKKAEAFNHALVIDRESNDPFPFVAVYCYAERPEFIQQLGTELRTDEIQEHELFNREHDCVFYQPATGHHDLEYAINLYNGQRVAMTLGRNELADYVQDEGLKKKRDCAEWWVTEPKRTC